MMLVYSIIVPFGMGGKASQVASGAWVMRRYVNKLYITILRIYIAIIIYYTGTLAEPI
jgi:hypothetical protein